MLCRAAAGHGNGSGVGGWVGEQCRRPPQLGIRTQPQQHPPGGLRVWRCSDPACRRSAKPPAVASDRGATLHRFIATTTRKGGWRSSAGGKRKQGAGRQVGAARQPAQCPLMARGGCRCCWSLFFRAGTSCTQAPIPTGPGTESEIYGRFVRA